jgi:CDP-paratose 2-epimerase
VRGRALNLGGGPTNAISLLELIGHIESVVGRRVPLAFEGWRAGDQRWFVADASMARNALGLRMPRPWRAGVAALAAWLEEERRPPRRLQAPPMLAGAAE